MKFSFSTLYSLSTLPKKADVLTPAEFREYVNTHGTPAQIAIMGNASTDWQNEIHPTRSGYKQLSAKWVPVLDAVL